MKIRNIEVNPQKCIAETQKFRIYLGESDGDGPVIVKVAKTYDDNDVLLEDGARFLRLRTLTYEIDHFEALVNTKSRSRFDLLYAKVLQTFLEPTQGDRRINVFQVPETDPSKLLPLSKLKADCEIDTRSSIWMLGRLFKFYLMFELETLEGEVECARYPDFLPEDFLIGPERHRVIYYNFTGDEPDAVAFDYVKEIAQFFLDWIVVEDEAGQKVYDLLEDFSKNGREKFEIAHADLYKLSDELWGRGVYYPFTYRDRGTIIWKKYNEEVD